MIELKRIENMKDKINEEVLCVLRKNWNSNKVEIDYITIENSFSDTLEELSIICKSAESDITQLIHFLVSNEKLDQLNMHFRYCESLNGSYQAFTGSKQKLIEEIRRREQLMHLNKKENPGTFDFDKSLRELKVEIIDKYILWSKAYSIKTAYRTCNEDDSVLLFSHRIDGWSNPLYQLTTNFSVEIKTNFGYGRASYFYTKLKYKDIEITPFSEWIDYEYAKFFEIVRYTQAYDLQNENWLEAMKFSRDACNLSMLDEKRFIENYVIDECEKMVSGLEEMFHKEHFDFKTRSRGGYSVDKKGHILIEYRGEKITGALEFISKILEFDHITEMKIFVERIEKCNEKIQPILIEEIKLINIKLGKLNESRADLKPQFDLVCKMNNDYLQKKNILKNHLISSGELVAGSLDIVKLDHAFILAHPEFSAFKAECSRITESYRIIEEKIRILTQTRVNIANYENKISNHKFQVK